MSEMNEINEQMNEGMIIPLIQKSLCIEKYTKIYNLGKLPVFAHVSSHVFLSVFTDRAITVPLRPGVHVPRRGLYC